MRNIYFNSIIKFESRPIYHASLNMYHTFSYLASHGRMQDFFPEVGKLGGLESPSGVQPPEADEKL